MRNLTMFICSINIGLRGGDFCKLKWKNIFDEKWGLKKSEKFNTFIKYVIKCKYVLIIKKLVIIIVLLNNKFML